MQRLIGRERGLIILADLKTSDSSAFVTVYDRRQVGKTFLIRKAFEDQFAFHLTGMANVNMAQQLTNFSVAIKRYDTSTELQLPAKTWEEAFQKLIKWLKKIRVKEGCFP